MPYRRVYILLGEVPSEPTALGSVNLLCSLASSGPSDSTWLQAIQCSMNSDTTVQMNLKLKIEEHLRRQGSGLRLGETVDAQYQLFMNDAQTAR